jgi:hypothetical protein
MTLIPSRRMHFMRVGVVLIMCTALCSVGCASSAGNSAASNPEIKAAMEEASRERQESEQRWHQSRQAFAQAANVDTYMMQRSGSVEDAKAWALVADTHRGWAGDSLEEFASRFQDSCVPSVTTAFDTAGSDMIKFGQSLANSPNSKIAKLSPTLMKYGSDLANLNTVCEQVTQQEKEAQEAQAAAVGTPSTTSATQPAASSDHPYLKAASEVVGLTLATALVAGLFVLDYEAARTANAPQTTVVAPTHCTSFQTGSFVNTDCY